MVFDLSYKPYKGDVHIMERNFELETILSVTTGISCTDDFGKVFELAWFVFNDDSIHSSGLCVLSETLKNHLLEIHPQLRGINYNSQVEINFDAWLFTQRLEHGETLSVCQINQTLEKSQNTHTR